MITVFRFASAHTFSTSANRLYTQIPVNVREATKTTIIPRGGGSDGQSPVLIRKGFGIGFSPYHMHRSKEVYGEDANEFRPERWEGPEFKNIGFGFMPFHGGPRICLGSEFTLLAGHFPAANCMIRGFRSHGSFLCYCAHSADFSESQTAAGRPDPADWEGKADFDSCGCEC